MDIATTGNKARVIESKLLNKIAVRGVGCYVHNTSKHAIAVYSERCAIPRKIATRGGNRFKRPSLSTCRREVDEILEASVYMIYAPLHFAFKNRKVVAKVRKIGENVLI